MRRPDRCLLTESRSFPDFGPRLRAFLPPHAPRRRVARRDVGAHLGRPRFRSRFSSSMHRLLPVLVLALVLASSAQTQSLRPSSAERTAIFDALAAKAARTGPVRVIVTLNVDWAPEGRQLSFAAERQRSEIRSQQKAVLRPLTAPEGVTQFRYIPALSLTVDAADLARLRASRAVVSIQEDVPVEAYGGSTDPLALSLAPLLPIVSPSRLDDSTVLVGAAAAWAAGYDGTGYEVAILDTGVQKAHPFLSGKVVSEA